MRTLLIGLTLALLGACQAAPPIMTANYVDLDRFAGDWYVIAYTPLLVDRNAHNPVESYNPQPDGTVATTYRFRSGSFDAEEKVYRPTGYIQDQSNAIWGMQFIWPFKAEYRVLYVDPEYQTTIVGRSARDYVWIMARDPSLPAEEYQALIDLIAAEGYELDGLVRAPHRWPEAS